MHPDPPMSAQVWDPAELEGLLDVGRAAAAAGARVAMQWRAKAGALEVTEKAGPGDLVSQADIEAEQAILGVIRARRPDDAVLGEEHGRVGGTSGVSWIVDPIDGTTNYLYGRPDWAVSVAAVEATQGRILVGVVEEPGLGMITYARSGGGTWDPQGQKRMGAVRDLQHALVETNFGRGDQKTRAGDMVGVLLPHVRDLRRGGSAASALAQVATGRADAVWAPGLSPWDCAAGILLVHEAGGTVGDLGGPSGAVVPSSGDVLAAGTILWGRLQTLLLQAYAT
jgi:myo-inositol-1(or 4)-monophosphatase